MFYERELQFLRETFSKCRVRTCVLFPEDKLMKDVDELTANAADIIPALSMNIGEITGRIESNTIYKFTDDFGSAYTLFRLPEAPYENILLIGPYLPSPMSSKQILEMGEKKGVPPKSQKILEEYYLNLPVLAESSHLFLMLDTFCERIWGSPLYSVVDIYKDRTTPPSPISDSPHSGDLDDISFKMKAIEQRYNYENDFMQAVSLGHMQKLNELLPATFSEAFEMRVADPIRNLKNYCIIMNTLLRKAAEKGGVHPIYLDSVSSSFAIKIEQITSFDECSAHMKEMFRGYCRLVRKHSTGSLSPLVQKVIILIDSDLSANLSLSVLAENQKVSPGYLSATFKKETGMTVTEYIRDKRIKHATYLLGTTHLQIQTVALHCGIMDVQYFSKIFKKQTGKTPKEYREFIKHSAT